MNILVIGTDDMSGGAAKISQDIRHGLERMGHTVSMFVADKKTDDPVVRRIPRSFIRKCLGFLLGTENFIATDWILATEEFKAADIIHCHNLHGRFFNLSTLRKMSLLKPVVWTLHDEWAITPHCASTFQGTEMRNGLYVCPSIDIPPRLLWDNSRRLAQTRNRIYKGSRLHIVTPSQWLKSRVETTVLKEQDVRLIPNGIDTSRFVRKERHEARAALDLPQDKKIVLFLADDARNNPWKGWSYTEKLIDQYTQDENVLFLCVGNTKEYEPEKNIIYRGRIGSPEELSLYYSAADTLLFTSIAENFPLVILESMSCGLPIVSFDVGGVREALTHKENGFIARYRNMDDLKEGLEWVLTLGSGERKALEQRSVEKIRSNYDTSLMIQRYMALYQDIQTKA